VGVADGLGVGVADGLGAGVGEGVGVGVAEGEGVGVGVAEGEGVGEGEDKAAAEFWTFTVTEAVPSRVSSEAKAFAEMVCAPSLTLVESHAKV
jgi:hypothetical protein